MIVKSLEKSVNVLYQKNFCNKKVKMMERDNVNYKNATHCHICEEELKNDKVLDRDHLTGKYRGAAQNECNLNYKIPKHIPVIFHNLANYDAHLFIKNIGVTTGKMDCIPNNEEKYISFKKEIIVGTYTDKKENLVMLKVRSDLLIVSNSCHHHLTH